jgi:hypothetical protein
MVPQLIQTHHMHFMLFKVIAKHDCSVFAVPHGDDDACVVSMGATVFTMTLSPCMQCGLISAPCRSTMHTFSHLTTVQV